MAQASTRGGQAVIECVGASQELCAKCPFGDQECERVWETGVSDDTSELQLRERLKAVLTGNS
jgi:hypothetical protein